MDKSKALSQLQEAADLLSMMEHLLSPSQVSKMSPAILAGMRVTIKNSRESILQSHNTLSAQLLETARGSSPESTSANLTGSSSPSNGSKEDASETTKNVHMRRSELRQSLEKFSR